MKIELFLAKGKRGFWFHRRMTQMKRNEVTMKWRYSHFHYIYLYMLENREREREAPFFTASQPSYSLLVAKVMWCESEWMSFHILSFSPKCHSLGFFPLYEMISFSHIETTTSESLFWWGWCTIKSRGNLVLQMEKDISPFSVCLPFCHLLLLSISIYKA
jgi:hypothetical protein